MKSLKIKKNTILFVVFLTGMFLILESFTSQNAQVQQGQLTDTFAFRKFGNTAFGYGEKLNFRMHYGFINAATAEIEVDGSETSIDGRPAIHIKAEGKTNTSFDWLYKVRDKFESWVDVNAMCPLKYSKVVREDKYKDQDLVLFKHPKKKLYGSKGNMDIIPYTQDIISAVYYARNIDFSKTKIGDRFPINIYLDNKIYSLQFKFAGRETISSDIGKVKCIKLIPKLVVDRVFKGEEDMVIWISDDMNKIPIRVQSEIQVGKVKCDLTKYSGLKNTFTALVSK